MKTSPQPAPSSPDPSLTDEVAGFIVGKGMASTGALERAVRLCARLATTRRAALLRGETASPPPGERSER